MIDAVGLAPRLRGFGYKFSVVGYEDSQGIFGLNGDRFVPDLERGTGFAFRTKRNRPDVAREIVD